MTERTAEEIVAGIDRMLERDGVAVVIKGPKSDSYYSFLGLAEQATSFQTGLPQDPIEAIGRTVWNHFKGDES